LHRDVAADRFADDRSKEIGAERYGDENFAAIPCLNDSKAGMLMIWQLAMRELKG
jgi:protoheme ferro-lyase